MAYKMTPHNNPAGKRNGKNTNSIAKMQDSMDNDKNPTYLAGQDIGRGPKGRVFTGVSIKGGPQEGDIIHGANKYADEDLNVQDFDFNYKPSSRGGWTITGVGR